MKVFISADIEGVSGMSVWNETLLNNPEYEMARKQMTREVAAACRGAFAAGATDVYVRDAHDSGRNIIHDELPEGVKLIKNWNGHPFSMMFGLTKDFDAVMFVGYHSGAGFSGNPLAHTMSFSKIFSARLNGELLTEFRLNAMTANYIGVPVVFASGDEGLRKDVLDYDEEIEYYSTFRGIGQATISVHPKEAEKGIEKGVEKSLKDIERHPVDLPPYFELEIEYRNHQDAFKNSFYPGVVSQGPRVLKFETYDFFELLRAIRFIM